MSGIGSIGGGRFDFGAADAAELHQVESAISGPHTTSHARDSGTTLGQLQSRLAADGKIDVADANQIIAKAKMAGISEGERSQVVSLLRTQGGKITPAALDVIAKGFGISLARPTPGVPGTGGVTTTGLGSTKFTISGDQSRGLSGTAKPGDEIEAINLSTAPAARLHLEDTVAIGKADAQGKWSGNLGDMQPGDIIRLRTKSADGTFGPWQTITAQVPGRSDTRAATLNLDRFTLEAKADGSVSVGANTDRPLTEPGAKVRFTNTRTGEKFDMTATSDGSVPKNFTVKGKAGDTFNMSVTDGKNNTTFTTSAGTLRVPGQAGPGGRVDLPDPALCKDDSGYTESRFEGPLFVNGPTFEDVRQGAIGDCYFPATFAAIAEMKPDAIKDMIKQNPDGTFTVRFYKNGNKSQPQNVTVDGDLYTRYSGTPLYGTTFGNDNSTKNLEMWFPIIEKAYAAWKGSYDKIGNGGNPGTLMAETLGGWGNDFDLPGANASRVFSQIKDGATKKLPMAAVTFGDSKKALYTDTGIYPDHTYTILGTKEKDGKQFVTLRNPWGESEPGFGSDGKDDGIFDLPLADFMKLYEGVSIAKP
ncbi:MAG TPA: C2 family cysteine protease [Planctomycetota bacterium]|nr:C2 family cysteine protease [Planctomycetota bacterium]